METLLLALLTAALLPVAAYAQYRTRYHTRGPRDALMARALLAAVGVAFGFVTATVYTRTSGLDQVLAFLSGFGAVHVPAAVILFIKRRRGEVG